LITFASASSLGPNHSAAPPGNNQALLCFSHLRWNFVFQRPQHLMSRFAKERRVVYWEEPEAALPDCEPALGVRVCAETGVTVVTPSLPEGLSEEATEAALKALLDDFLAAEAQPLIRWYYTPMMLPFSRHIQSVCTVYDCMDELANFRFAPPQLLELERELINCSDVVFTGGYSLYEAKKDRHPNVHPFPSSVDRAHFAQARAMDAGAGRSMLAAQAAPRLLRRDRRADRPRSPRRPCRGPSGMVDRHGRAGREDRSRRSAAAREHPLSRRQEI
jgi:UDP-galactopyranose mutase